MQRVMQRYGHGPVTLLRRAALLATALLILVAVSGSAFAAPERGPKVYLLRGFLNVFSLGLDELATKIERRGIRAEVYNHTSWRRLVGEIAAEYKSGQTRPIVLIGHSQGGNSLIDLVEGLGHEGVPVALAVTLDIASVPIPSGRVGTFLNLYARTGALTAGPGFRGKLVNMDMGKDPLVGHFSIDKVDAVHNLILRYVASAVGRPAPRRQPAQANAPTPPRS
jgi:hypothetical protein